MSITYIFTLLSILLLVLYLGLLVRRKYGGIDFSQYAKRKFVLNDSELALYINLVKELGAQYMVLSKVRIEDFVEVKYQRFNLQIWNALRSRIKSRHVDFLICDRIDSHPLLAIELDGLSHQSSDRKIRDSFIDKLYEKVGLPITHVGVGSNFADVASQIHSKLDL